MNNLKGINIRLYPNTSQQIYLAKLFGCQRFVYNSCLDLKIKKYNDSKEIYGLKELINYFHQNLRPNNEFLKEHNTKVLKCSVINLLDAYKRFFINGTGFPKFKSKHSKQSVQFPLEAISKDTFKNNKLQLTKQLKNLKFKTSDIYFKYLTENKGLIHNITISKSTSGKYYASILIEFTPDIKPVTNKVIGIDLGINSYLTDSNNQKIENPKWLRKKVKGLKHYQQILSKKTKGSKNYKKIKAKIAKTHEKIVNQRKNFLHNLSSKIISENQVICLENLAIKEMMKKHSLAGAIQELSWYEFKVQLTYKAKWYNRDLILVDRYYPSTKTCSRCKNKQEIGLEERTYVCESCGLEIDRDYNASLNILNEGLRILSRRSDSHNLVL